MLCCATAIFAQNDKISYQAVVRDTANRLVVNKTVTVTVNVFNGDATTATYSETHTNVQTNYNGMFSLQIGNGTNKNGDWNAINWKNARVTTAVFLNGTELATLEMPLTAVPYTFYADSATLAGFATNAHYLETYQIPTEAEVNVQSDWAVTDTTSDTYIQHKPNISDSIGTYLTNNHYIDQTALYNQGYLNTKANTTDIPTTVSTFTNDAKYVSNNSCDSLDFCGLIAIVNNLATDMRGFQHDVNNLKDSINDLNAKISALENTIRILAGYQKVLDLSTVTSDTTIYNGQTVTGKLKEGYKISILNGAIVTLNGVNINGDSSLTSQNPAAGLTCLGNATIILKDGTTNIVRGLNQNCPGVFVPEGSTLTIQGEAQGTGKLIASSNGYGAGIGGGSSISCGHIIIKSGTIEATGGDGAAGIGGGSGSGAAYPSSCGNITIENTVNHVKATKGTNATNSIGAGIYGSCSTVTIEAGANVIQN